MVCNSFVYLFNSIWKTCCICRLLLEERQRIHDTPSRKISPRIVKMVSLSHILHHPGIKATPTILTILRSSLSMKLLNLKIFSTVKLFLIIFMMYYKFYSLYNRIIPFSSFCPGRIAFIYTPVKTIKKPPS